MKYIITLALLCSVNLAWAATINGRVVGITDGDTITVLSSTNTQYKIRLSAIDAPEKRQNFGNVSKQALSNLIFNKEVTVETNYQLSWGRPVGVVYLDGEDINLQQIKNGMAWFSRKYENNLTGDDRLRYLRAEEDAIRNKIGLWGHPKPVAPWDFRSSRKQMVGHPQSDQAN